MKKWMINVEIVLDKLLIVHTLKFLEENLNLLFEGNYLIIMVQLVYGYKIV